MSVRSIELFQRYLRRLCDEAVPSEDAVLLNRFVAANDREAFELLIARHGPMVLGTARRLVDNTHDAEDVFQAVFLSLARLAKTIRQGRALPAWLHKTTCRIAAKVRKNRVSGSKEPPPEPCENIDPGAGLVWQEVRQALDEELQRLPERLRSPLLLCYLSGLTRDEAAKQLGWSLGTLKRRLEEGRKALRIRLERRGIASVGLALTVLAPEALQAALSKSLLESSLSMIFSTGAAVPATISVLVLSSTTAMKGIAMKSILALLAAISIGVGIYAGTGLADPPKKAEGKKEEAKPDDTKAADDLDRLQGTWKIVRAPGPALADTVALGSWSISGTKLTITSGKETFERTFRLDTTKNPREIVINFADAKKGEYLKASYQLAGDDLKLSNGSLNYEFKRDAPWGEAVEGVQCRLQADQRAWKKGEVPTFKAEVRNQGKRKLGLAPTQGMCVVEVDGRTYTWSKPVPALGGTFSPGDHSKDISVSLGKEWKEKGRVSPNLSPGKHKVRIVFHVSPEDLVREKPVLPVSNTVEIEIVADQVKPAQEENVVQVDDPLPAGSTLRFGTSRFRYGTSVKTLAISPDGKTAFVTNDNGIPRAFDLATGRVLFSLNWGSVEAGVYSPDGRTLVLKQNFDLCVFDAANGKELRTIKGARKNLRHSGVPVFTPDGKAIATISDGKDVHLIDFESGNTIRDFVHEIPKSGSPSDFPQVLAIAFSVDGKLMATGGYANEKGNYFARLWEVENGKELRRFMHGEKGYGIGSLTFSPDGKTLATLGTQGGVFLRLFDVDTGKERKAFPKDGEVRPSPGSVVFSPDGKTVAAALNSIHLYDTTTGEERLRIDRRASVLHFTDDGKTLTAAVSGAIYRWDTTTGKTLTPEAADSTVEQILVSADGSRVITRGQNSDGYIWDGATGKLLRRIPVAYSCGLAISPDGRFLAWPVDDYDVQFKDPQEPGSTFYGSRIRLYDLAADKFVDRFPSFKGSAQDLAFSNDGRKIVTVESYGGMVRIWDFAAGKEERSFEPLPKDLPKNKSYRNRTLLSPDGRTVVKTYVEDRGGRLGGLGESPHLVRHWDVASGRELPVLNGGHPIDKAFSPDGRLVVTRGENCVCEIATGKRVAALPDDPMQYIRAAAFSRDGRFLAIAVPEDLIQIWEVATWTKRYEFKGYKDRSITLPFGPTKWETRMPQPSSYKDRSITLTFGPGGRLFTGNLDTTVLAWNMRPPHVADSVTLESAWNDLATREASESFKSEGRFLAAPAETVKLLAEKIKPVEALDPKQIQRLLADLGSDVFAVREAASKTLLELDQQAKPYLEKTLKSAESAEVRVRVKRILEQQQGGAITSEQLRQIRAVMVLELIGDGESKNLLKKWAGGPVGALLTREASLALKRLEAVSKANR